MSSSSSNNNNNINFGVSSTAEEVVQAYGASVKGKVVIVTGSNTGIGFETARALASVGAKVFAAARSQAKSENTVKRLKEKTSAEADVHPLELELGSLASVRKAAAAFLALNLPLDILILNAGIMACPKAYTQDGIESQFGVNHIGHFLFTTLLYNKIKETKRARVVSVSSLAHYMFNSRGILFDDLGTNNDVHHYNRWERYGNSKLANVLFAKELQRRFEADGADATAVSLHPGGIAETELQRQPGQYGWDVLRYLPGVISSMFTEPGGLANLKKIPQGASTSVYCAIAPGIVKGEYYNNCAVAKVNVNRFNNDEAMAKRLWKVSEAIVASK